ncbi:AfsR/SARP family transcriptional regulator [Streptomyces endophyticus]|uniref:Transcriptional regulator n=1 Tax=Streptomyces endophyticus TaxID=714166 RepID=A0ABU6F387_9ACTN|nr:BTAD domain-containing putative transcriptional regulator [Streptomyces endophyticus]MEB8338471.1 transcriptional regulator [Streptomyces endophyticus]
MRGQPAGAVSVQLLQGFTLNVDGTWVPTAGSAQRLIAYLAVRRRPLSRSHVAESLWPDTPPDKAAANLRSTLWRVHKSCPCTLNGSAPHLLLAPEVTVDLNTVQDRAHRLLDRATPCDDLLTPQTCAELSVDLLPDWSDEWLIAVRERHHHLRLHALETLCERLSRAGRHGESIEAGLAAVHAEPLRESAHATLIRAHVAAGNRWEAARQYERCRRILLREIALEPTPELRSLLPAPLVR